MKTPQKLYFALNYNYEAIRGYVVIADKQHTKGYLDKKARADRSAGQNCKELFLDNTPSDGFRVSDFDYSGMFWIEHPQGFNVSITARNMYDLMRTSTIINGEIQNKLYFDMDLNLISEVSEILASNVAVEEKRQAQQKAAKELKLNQKFSIPTYNGSNEYIFISRLHVMEATKEGGTLPPSTSKLQYLYFDPIKSVFITNTELNITLQDSYEDSLHFRSLEHALREFKNFNISSSNNIIAVSAKPIKYKDIKTRFVETPLSELVFSNNYPRLSVIEENGNYRFLGRINNKNGQNITYDQALKEFAVVFDVFHLVEEDGLTLRTRNYWYYSRSSNNCITVNDVEKLPFKTGYLEYYI
ncbi:hypothetical protein XaC1_145 [Xanthomonas phage XaC1]|nr:hypothetical protein XaC1_145 [Xanthomonas phage XaC1]